jgi:RNA polymerase sigma factor (sigma-70 family)
MSKESNENRCPLKLLSRYCDKIVPHQQSLNELDEYVRQYLALPKTDSAALRERIFFKLSPFLLKSLSWYCHISSGCGVNCQVSELLSTAYIVFTDLIDRFDFSRHLNFLGYVVNGLSWGIFNSFMKERRYLEHRILLPYECSNGVAQIPEPVENEERGLSAIELEELLSTLTPEARTLFVLHHLFGYSYADLAAINNTKDKAVQKATERARKKMLAAQSKKFGQISRSVQ